MSCLLVIACMTADVQSGRWRQFRRMSGYGVFASGYQRILINRFPVFSPRQRPAIAPGACSMPLHMSSQSSITNPLGKSCDGLFEPMHVVEDNESLHAARFLPTTILSTLPSAGVGALSCLVFARCLFARLQSQPFSRD
jgi:hypothetical protein